MKKISNIKSLAEQRKGGKNALQKLLPTVLSSTELSKNSGD